MSTIAEILAAKQAAKKPVPAPTTATKKAETLAEKAEVKEAIDRIDPPGKRQRQQAASATGLVLNKDMPGKPESRGQATSVRGPEDMPERRSLSETQGEGIPMTPEGADPATTLWHHALQGFESDLCVMRDPKDPEAVWLAVKPDKPELPPILILRLPWLLWEHPRQATQGEAF